jgi:hypothetical protein
MPGQPLALTIALQIAADPNLTPQERLEALKCVTKLTAEIERRLRRLAKNDTPPSKLKKRSFTIMDEDGI